MLLALLGDALWIISLSIMASTTRAAWGRIDPETKVPLQFALSGKPTFRVKRNLALLAIPTAAFFLGLALVAFNRNAAASLEHSVILFGVRATAAALIAVGHLRWLKAALDQLQSEGALKP
ncbi:MAG: hypothetical protein Q8N10_06010 [Phenylobacterium sp.]|jgi:hypothetical protein|uniref:Uncharacterized protein n=1 Tax=Phenylobacterium ferrooxidans TaxID=2982689 RepID=A0ABW6CSV2_9CAUL|nr:hypothetical protein [Phenylobacterium sp.]MDO8324863.1 hypothetical protein [Phenylobacterium sp.]MDO8913194.1 hypothetical protein [Phenylobacterium sp.]MDP3100038.1 hypothetical protein [Phenylobacterium sp.]MDP3634634.1 hypothetical protein [Phenylobacterium sp.]MDP3870657.1 hypothetical protein [Phenylobacterium sp.]